MRQQKPTGTECCGCFDEIAAFHEITSFAQNTCEGLIRVICAQQFYDLNKSRIFLYEDENDCARYSFSIWNNSS